MKGINGQIISLKVHTVIYNTHSEIKVQDWRVFSWHLLSAANYFNQISAYIYLYIHTFLLFTACYLNLLSMWSPMYKAANQEVVQKEMLHTKLSILLLQTPQHKLQAINLPHLEQGSVRTLKLIWLICIVNLNFEDLLH